MANIQPVSSLLNNEKSIKCCPREEKMGITCTAKHFPFIFINSISSVQWEPENYGIRRWLWGSNYDFKKSKEHETQQLCSVNRKLNLSCCKIICFVTLNTIDYCYKVVFLFNCFLISLYFYFSSYDPAKYTYFRVFLIILIIN